MISYLLLWIAFILLLLACFGVKSRVNLVAAGLAVWALSQAVAGLLR